MVIKMVCSNILYYYDLDFITAAVLFALITTIAFVLHTMLITLVSWWW